MITGVRLRVMVYMMGDVLRLLGYVMFCWAMTVMAREIIRPCAACKHLGQSSNSSCDLAPYFPVDNLQRFNVVHSVFGRRNVSKMLQEIDVSHREQAADVLVYEAKARLRDPVFGCVGLTSILEQRLKEVQENLRNVKNELTKYLSLEIIEFVLSNPDLFGFAPDNNQNPHVSQYLPNVSPPAMTISGGQLAISEPQLSTVHLKALQTHNLELLKQMARSGPNGGGGLTGFLLPGHFPFRDVVLPSSGLNTFENGSTSITSNMGLNPISGGSISCSDGDWWVGRVPDG